MFSGPLKLQPSGDSAGELFCSKQTSLQQDDVVAALLEAHASALCLLQSKSHCIVSIVGEVTSQSICNIWCNTIMVVLVDWQKKRSSAIAVLSGKRSLKGIWRWLTSKHWSEKASERRRPMWRLSAFRYAHSYTFHIMSRPSAVLFYTIHKCILHSCFRQDIEIWFIE